ncbi:MAG: TIGR03663 family protein [Anaerolineales bacterium]|nr:MAG: TIGR03663 family protein [Anaerolineales bacterium]
MSKTAEKDCGLLDRPVFGSFRLTWWTVCYGALILFVVLTRLWDLAPRGYSHDESIHAWESWKLVTGQGYVHNPVYHGPFLYHFTALIFALFGHNDYTARLSPALFGVALTVLPLFLRKWLGKKGVLATTLLMAVSPVMMHRSRYLRMDMFAATFNLLLLIAILRYQDQRRDRDLYLAAAALCLSLTAKETSFITDFIFGTFLLALFLWQWLNDRGRPWKDSATFDLIVVIGT